MKKKKFATLRAWNRKRNYLMKDIRYYLNLFLQKLCWDKTKKTAINISAVKSILILRNEGKIGDVIVDTSVIKVLKEHHYCVDMLVTHSNAAILEYNPNIRNVYIADNNSLDDFMKKRHHNVNKDILIALKNNHYDLIIDPSMFNTPIHRPRLLKAISAKNVISFNKKSWLKHYSQSIPFDYNLQHITESYKILLTELNIKNIDLHYDLYYPEEIDNNVATYLSALPQGRKNIIINIFAGIQDRCLSLSQAKEIDDKLNAIFPNINVIILDHKKEIPQDAFKYAKIYNPQTLLHTVALIAKADLVISPDTSIVHIAATYQCPLVAIYKDAVQNNTLWGPGYNNADQLFVKDAKTFEDKQIVNDIISSAKKYLSRP